MPLAVTVTDQSGNAVSGAAVTFRAPASGASGAFAGSGAAVVVVTDANGVATAPYFSANETPGGYIVTAKVAGLAAQATFALVNTARTTASVSGPAGTYWLVTSTGKVLTSGAAANYGSTGKLSSKAVDVATTPGGRGYWVVTAAGHVYAFGNAKAYGYPAKVPIPIVGMAGTPDGKGYWLVASDGAVYAYGDAVSHGSPAKAHLASPIVGMAATADGKGYWLVASDGGIFNLRRRRLPRLGRPPQAQKAHRGHGRHRRRQGLLAGGFGRRHLRLRLGHVLRVPALAHPPAGQGPGGHARRRRLLGRQRQRHRRRVRRRRRPGVSADGGRRDGRGRGRLGEP